VVALSGPATWLWIAAPAMALHWSASGDVFVRLAGGEVHKIRYIDGDGLSPMRFSTLEPSGLCADWPCILDAEIGRIALPRPDADATACHPRADAAYELVPHALTDTGERSVNCAEPVLWSDVVRTGAITLNTKGAPSKKTAPCKARPWKPCGVETD